MGKKQVFKEKKCSMPEKKYFYEEKKTFPVEIKNRKENRIK